MSNGTLRKLLAQNLNAGQIVGYALAALTGMSILFAAFCFSRDVQPLFAPGTSIFGESLIVVNKDVPFAAAFDPSLTAFTPAEIDEIAGQPFVTSLSRFTSSRFRVKAYMEATGTVPYFSTDLFFESVPDKALDVRPPEWGEWDSAKLIPIMIPRDYLNLYNFGFAGTQSLPQISEDIVQKVSFRVTLIGNGLRENFPGRIVGFSEQLNTILVPEAFMQWANNRYGERNRPDRTSRLILEVSNPTDPAIASFFAAHKNLKISDNKGEQGKLSYFLTMLIVIVMAVGCLILAPAIGLMMVSINLLVYKNRETVGNLILLGYTRQQLALPYCVLATALNLFIGLLSLTVAGCARHLYAARLDAIGATPSGSTAMTVLFALGFVVFVSLLDAAWIRRSIRKIGMPAMG